MNRSIRMLLCAALLLALAQGCAGVQYRDDVPLDSLSQLAERQLNADSLAAMTDSYLDGVMKLDTAMFADYIVKVTAYGASIDEYGLFLAPDEASVPQVRKAAEDYLQRRRDAWMEEYMPEEKPKLEQAEVRALGRYVYYLIVSPQARETISADLENALKK